MDPKDLGPETFAWLGGNCVARRPAVAEEVPIQGCYRPGHG